MNVQLAGQLMLAYATATLLLVANAARPLRRPAPLALASFFAGWLTNELALLHLLAIALVTALGAIAGGLGHWTGWLALPVMAFSAYRLWSLQLEAERTVDHVGTALQAAPAEPQRFVFPWPLRPADVEVVRNVPYAWSHRRQRLDVYRHRSRPTKAPAFLYVHGGAWVIGNKRQQGLMTVHRLAQQGFVCFSINYRLAPMGTFPEPLIDVKRAIAWIRRHGAEFGADPERIYIGGGSAGAHLSMLAALTPNDTELQPGFESIDTRVHGVVAYYGVYDLLNREKQWPHYAGVRRLWRYAVIKRCPTKDPGSWRSASPIDRLHPGAPPMLLVHGEYDTLAPAADARLFVEEARRIGVSRAILLELPRAQHAFEIFPSTRSRAVVDGVAQFVSGLVREHGEGLTSSLPSHRLLDRPTPAIDAQQLTVNVGELHEAGRLRRHGHGRSPQQ
ncbi:MAG: alpha/beta hydrolase [Myxococcales bacterium]|nr:alpha/beta hydrolase [Myxococcales bacterium]